MCSGVFYCAKGNQVEDHYISQRLDRIENKVDDLTEVMTSLARIEERSANQNAAIQRMGSAIDRHDGRISALENSKSGAAWTGKAAVWLVALLVSVAGIAATLIK
jgi:tetrahydromethanopterin S-methyltransferase subunit G